MARKDLLRGLMGMAQGEANVAEAVKPTAPAFAPASPRLNKGAIGAVGQSIADLRARSVIEVAADLIDGAGLEDRLDEDLEGIEILAQSLRAYGQQVPVLLRHSAKAEGRYEVVYGRRRVAALRVAGLPVKAMLRDLSDRDLVLAQGQENTQRKDLSFIEKANFARQMRDQGFDRAVICDALAVDKTVISRMLNVVDTVPLALLHAIGAAPSVGRDRWLALGAAVVRHDLAALIAQAKGEDSDSRFDAVFGFATALPAAPAPAPRSRALPQALHGAGDLVLGEVKREGGHTILRLSQKAVPGFDEWLLREMSDLHKRFVESGGK